MALEDTATKILNQDNFSTVQDSNATSRAVDTLISTQRKTKRGEETDTELKTDLSDDEVRIHALLHSLSDIFEMTESQFSEKCVLGTIINRKERKAWSKDRKSRTEIVEIVRQPNVPVDMQQGIRKEGLIRRFFMPRQV